MSKGEYTSIIIKKEHIIKASLELIKWAEVHKDLDVDAVLSLPTWNGAEPLVSSSLVGKKKE